MKRQYGIWLDKFTLSFNHSGKTVKHCGMWCKDGKNHVRTFTDIEAARTDARAGNFGQVDWDVHMESFERPHSIAQRGNRCKVLCYRVRLISEYEIKKLNRVFARNEKMIEARNREWEEGAARQNMTVEEIEKQIIESNLYNPAIKQLLLDLTAAHLARRYRRKAERR